MDLKLLYIITNFASMESISQFIGFLKSLGYVVIDWFIDFSGMILCVICKPEYVFCFCCGQSVSTVCKTFYIVLCDQCKLQHCERLLAVNLDHGLFVPYKKMLKI
jgi:hypothetical protein